MIVLVLLMIIVYMILYSSIRVNYLTSKTSRVDLLFADPLFVLEQTQRQTALNQLTSARLLLESTQLSITNLENTLLYNTRVRDNLQLQYNNLIAYIPHV